MNDTGYHYFIDAKTRSSHFLGDRVSLQTVFRAALKDFEVIGFLDHKFGEGGGVTGIFLLAESHCSYHTYPESQYIAIDIFTCGREPVGIVDTLREALDLIEHSVRFQLRGSVCIPSLSDIGGPPVAAVAAF